MSETLTLILFLVRNTALTLPLVLMLIIISIAFIKNITFAPGV
jgi:hypothetical protein